MRSKVPRSSHAAWEQPGDRPSPNETLAAQDKTRVQELVPVRYGRMLASPFTLLSRRRRDRKPGTSPPRTRSGLDVQLCGDAHLSNFGIFRAPDRTLVFDINDFDETHPGPFEWDLKRLAASLEIAGRDRGFKPKQRRIVATASARYLQRDGAVRRHARPRRLVFAARRVGDARPLDRQYPAGEADRLEKNIAKAKNKDSLRALGKLTVRDDQGMPRIASRPPLLVPIEELAGDRDVGAAVKRVWPLP